ISFRYLDPSWLSNLDLEALLQNLPEGWNDLPNTTIFEYETDYEGTLLFRSESYGDYTRNWLTGQWSWGSAPNYDTTGDEIVPQNFYPTKIQTQGRVQSKFLTITPKQNIGGIAMVPLNSPSVYHPSGDSRFDADYPNYSFNYYPYDEVPDSLVDEPILNTTLKQAVETYSAYAYSHYTAVDDDVKATMREYALRNGINPDSPTLARDLIRFTKEDNYYPVALDSDGNPTLDDYSLKDCPSTMSPIVYFATEYHKGIWTHFAQAAVLYCRSFGIPARYVSGYRENVNDPENAIGIKEIWNWCEAWSDTAGWVPYDPGISINLRVRADQMTGGISGMIGKGQGEVPNDTPVALFTVVPESWSYEGIDDPTYFRYASYGDYSRKLWGAAPEDPRANDYGAPANAWMGTQARMMNGEGSEASCYIQATTSLQYALTPSYSTMVNDVAATYADDHISFEAEPQIITYEGADMSIYSYSYPYFIRNVTPLQIKLRGYNVFPNWEYEEWVNKNFLNYEDSENPEVGETVRSFIERENLKVPQDWEYPNRNSYYEAKDQFWTNLNNKINSLADSVYYAANLDDSEDPVCYLLKQSIMPRQANHTMLASAEVLVLRALGIPARYVSGFVGRADGNMPISFLSPSGQEITPKKAFAFPTSGILTAANGYAWCEAYEEGVGWRRLDPTSPITVEGRAITTPGELDGSDRYNANPLIRNITAFYDGTVPN
ncbi:MAG: hypothetical protein J5736_01485, partial [Bacilli bacterium]|nr:hypothetical protein [Bacilli bacterium]